MTRFTYALLLIGSAALADEAKKPSAAEQAAMEKMMKAGTPGPEHQQMAKMVGKWKVTTKTWSAPGKPGDASERAAEYRTLYGGRYLEETMTGKMDGMDIEGRGIEGYDNVTKEYFGTWIDNMSTSFMFTRGKCKADKCTFRGKMTDPVAGKEVPVNTTMTRKDDNTYVWEMTQPGPDGKQFKSMEMTYTRQP